MLLFHSLFFLSQIGSIHKTPISFLPLFNFSIIINHTRFQRLAAFIGRLPFRTSNHLAHFLFLFPFFLGGPPTHYSLFPRVISGFNALALLVNCKPFPREHATNYSFFLEESPSDNKLCSIQFWYRGKSLWVRLYHTLTAAVVVVLVCRVKLRLGYALSRL